MEATLVVVGPKSSKRNIKVKFPMIIGRSRKARLMIAHPMVSRRHSELYEVNGLLMIRDLGSLNGTLVGGQRVKESPLPPEAEFSVGPVTFRAQYEYKGDLKALPAAVPDNRPAAPVSAEEADMPDFEAILEQELPEPEPSETAIAAQPAVSRKPAASKGRKEPETTTAPDAAKKSAKKPDADEKSSDDPFDDLLSEFG